LRRLFEPAVPNQVNLRVADLGAEAVLGFVARPGVGGGDPRRIGQAGAQHGAGFVEEARLAGDQPANDPPLFRSRRRTLASSATNRAAATCP